MNVKNPTMKLFKKIQINSFTCDFYKPNRFVKKKFLSELSANLEKKNINTNLFFESNIIKKKKVNKHLNITHRLESVKTDDLNFVLNSFYENHDNEIEKELEFRKSLKHDQKELKEKFKKIQQLFIKEKLTIVRYESLKEILNQSFFKSQLLDYAKKNKFNDVLSEQNITKLELINYIVFKIWKIKTPIELTDLKDLVVIKNIVFDKLKLLLLKSELKKKTLNFSDYFVEVDCDEVSSCIKIRGQKNHISSSVNYLNTLFSKFCTKQVNLEFLKKLDTNFNKNILLTEIEKKSRTFVRHIKDEIYEIMGFDEQGIQKALRFLLWNLNYNHKITNIKLFDDRFKDIYLYPYRDDHSLPWDKKQKNYFTCRRLNFKNEHDDFTKINKKMFCDEFLNESFFDLDIFINQLDTHQTLGTNEVPLKNSINYNNFYYNTLGTSEDVNINTNNNTNDLKSSLPADLVNKAYSYLFDDDNEKSDKILALRLGKLLLSPNELLENKRQIISSLNFNNFNFFFDSNTSYLNNKILTQLLYQHNVKSSEINFLSNQYSIFFKIKFVPSILDFDKKKLKSELIYPIVEMILEIDHLKNIDFQKLKLYAIKKKKMVFISTPQYNSDIEISLTTMENLLTSKTYVDKNDQPSDLELDVNKILNSTISLYSNINFQPGIKSFLLKSNLNFNNTDQIIIDPYLNLMINSNEVRYMYLDSCLINQINWKSNENNLSLNHNIKKNIDLGGIKYEAVFFNKKKIDKKIDLIELIDNSIKLIQ